MEHGKSTARVLRAAKELGLSIDILKNAIINSNSR